MIIVDKLWPHFLKSQDYNQLSEYGIHISSITQEIKNNPENFIISWGDNVHQSKCAVMESGFFWDAIHIDSIGLYEKASFNFPFSKKIIESFQAKQSFRDLQSKGLTKSKFNQPKNCEDWNGVVIIAQHPGDRSVWKAGSTGDYHNFLNDACSYYGNKALIKLHPVIMGNAKELEIVRGIANKYGSKCEHVDISVINNAEFVLVYNSTFVVDALAAKKHVVQYAPGYFWQSGVTQFSSKTIPQTIQTCDSLYIEKFLDFLIWKYCFHKMLPMSSLAEIVKSFARSKELFPLPEDLSYASYMLNKNE